ncbi:hypothetical protein A9Q81_16400 [Gammaproteobacteria bacterium 42_54_T18]|nr:hypothetical protein A9Q81_16400 [Gammaproteobacteria bacterium 42_54_T18]
MNNTQPIYDAFIIGGGINGAAIANNLASKGFYVAICDENDVSGEASSHGNKLFQCGLEHLEKLNLSHVSNALKERETLCLQAPHLMQAIDIIIPDAPTIRSSLKIKAGSMLYGWLLRSETSIKPYTENIQNSLYSEPLKTPSLKATLCQEYLVNDSRLVVENLLSAERNHCQLLSKTKVVSGSLSNGTWKLKLQDSINGDQVTVSTHCIVNAAGAWAQSVLKQALGCKSRCEQPLEKHSFIAVPKFYEGQHGYMLQLPNQQFLSILPYATNYCLVGPVIRPVTNRELTTAPSPPKHNNTPANEEESSTLLQQLNYHFNTSFSPNDISWSFSSVRPATQDSQPVHMLDLQCSDGRSPVISVFSGHITTHRVLAEQVYECIHPYLPSPPPSLKTSITDKLPGGDYVTDAEPGVKNYEELTKTLKTQYFWLPKTLLARYCITYGTRAKNLLYGAVNLQSLGEEVLPTIYERELNWLIETEWVTCTEDVLWRRTKLGINVTEDDAKQLDTWFKGHYQHNSAVSKIENLANSNCKAS